MNKLLTKIAGLTLGLTMAIGVGVAAFSNAHEPVGVHALTNTYTKITDVSVLSAGDKVVIASGSPTSGLTGWNGDKDATVSGTEADWIHYQVETASGGWYLKDPEANKYIASPGNSNQFKYGTKAVCSVDGNGVLKCNSRFLCKNGSYYRMYTSVGTYVPFYVWKVSVPSTTVDVTGIDIEQSSATINVGQRTTLTATVSPSNASNPAFTWESSNPDVASVNGGVVTGLSVGTTTITATTDQKGYKDTCTITVNKTNTYYELVSDVNDLTLGTQFVIASTDQEYALGIEGTSNRKAVDVVKINNNLYINSDAQVLTLTSGVTEGTFGFYTGSAYLYSASNSSNDLKTQNTIDANGSWNIAIDSDGVATIKSTGSNARNWIRFNSTSKLFSSYGSGQNNVSFYKQVSLDGVKIDSIDITTEGPITLKVGEEFSDLDFSVLPVNHTEKYVFESNSTDIASVDINGVITGVSAGETTITIKSASGNAQDTIDVVVTKGQLEGVSVTSRNANFVVGTYFKDHFTNTQNIIELERENKIVDILEVTDANLTFTLNSTKEKIDINQIITKEFGNFTVTYTDATGTKDVNYTGVTLVPGVEFTATTNDFTGDNNYLIENDNLANVTFSYVSYWGQLDEEVIELSSTNDDVVYANEIIDQTYSADTKKGTITVNIRAIGPGTAYINIYARHEVYNAEIAELSFSSNLIIVRPEVQAGETVEEFVKVKSTNDLTSGDYLIVYEGTGSVAFNGSLTKLDAANNGTTVTIADGKIASSSTLKKATFTIDTEKGTIKSSSGYYIGQNSNANGLLSNESTQYTNTFSFTEGGDANIVSSGGAYLRYNSASDQLRFRYYKSSSYSGQKAITLYKLTTVITEAVDNYTGVVNFINDYMQPTISHTDSGSGECVNWYAGENGAKAAFEALTTAEKNILVTEYNEMFLRLQAWAIANGETIEYDPSAETYVIKNTNNSLMAINNSFDSTLLILFACISFVSVTAIVIVRKRKEQ